MRVHTSTHPGNHMHARTQHAQSCTDRPVSNIYCFPTARVIRQRVSVLRCKYIASLVFLCYVHLCLKMV
jgi:hypothetical protein